PALPQIFRGRESELEQALNTLQLDSPRLAILGMGGIGKTTLATAALNHPNVISRFPSRYFVSCHSVATVTDLFSIVASHVGLAKGTNSATEIIKHLKYSPATLLVLDNLETVWESVGMKGEAEDFLSSLTDVQHLALVITMRGAERPQKVAWSHPFLPPLKPLSPSAAVEMFLDIADPDYDEQHIHQILELTGNLPLAISLMASVVACEGYERTLERWQTERTRLLSNGHDKQSSLDTSIMTSISGARMTPGALQLLALLCMLPDGLSEAELIQSKLPIPKIHACKTTLLRTSLAYKNNLQHLTVLVPIREYILIAHPVSAEIKIAFFNH
ncbi:P-loop containing nucleoside triphosphate hydrolase protein, partial [Mycena albidolilacea]